MNQIQTCWIIIKLIELTTDLTTPIDRVDNSIHQRRGGEEGGGERKGGGGGVSNKCFIQ